MNNAESSMPHSNTNVFTIGIGGASCSGKSTFANALIDKLCESGNFEASNVMLFKMDNFYFSVPSELNNVDYNFDSPEALDFELIRSTLRDVNKGISIDMPQFLVPENVRGPSVNVPTSSTKIVIVDGVFSLIHEDLRQLYDLCIFVDVEDVDLLIRRRYERNPSNPFNTESYFRRFIYPGYLNYILPSKKYADMIISGSNNNARMSNILSNALSRGAYK